MEPLKRTSQRFHCFELLLISLAVFQKSWHVSALNVASISDICGTDSYSQSEIRLTAGGSTSAASLLMNLTAVDVEPRICVVEIHAPNTHAISLQLAGLAPAALRLWGADRRRNTQACPLSVFSAAKGSKVPRLLRTVDLCDDDEATTTFTELYNRHHVRLIWTTPRGNFLTTLQASEIVITAVGIGTGVCKKYWPLGKSPTHFPCWKQYGKQTPYCVASELLCDGRRNCPNDGEDEDPDLCDVLMPTASDVRRHKEGSGRTRSGHQVVQTIAQPVGKKEEVTVLHSVENGRLNATDTTTENVLQIAEDETFPEALNRYGPWGYLMLGLLICGSVLVVCGIWECCCRRPKVPVETSAPPVYVIGNGQPEQDAVLPPAYDDLDQPPAYSILFPTLSKVELPGFTEVTCLNEVRRTGDGSGSANSAEWR